MNKLTCQTPLREGAFSPEEEWDVCGRPREPTSNPYGGTPPCCKLCRDTHGKEHSEECDDAFNKQEGGVR